MKHPIFLAAAFVPTLIVLVPQPGHAQNARGEIEAVVKDYLAAHPDEVGTIVKRYLIEHPEAVGEILAAVLKHRQSAKASLRAGNAAGARPTTAVDRSAAVARNAGLMFSSPHQVILGNPHGDVTLESPIGDQETPRL